MNSSTRCVRMKFSTSTVFVGTEDTKSRISRARWIIQPAAKVFGARRPSPCRTEVVTTAAYDRQYTRSVFLAVSRTKWKTSRMEYFFFFFRNARICIIYGGFFFIPSTSRPTPLGWPGHNRPERRSRSGALKRETETRILTSTGFPQNNFQPNVDETRE